MSKLKKKKNLKALAVNVAYRAIYSWQWPQHGGVRRNPCGVIEYSRVLRILGVENDVTYYLLHFSPIQVLVHSLTY